MVKFGTSLLLTGLLGYAAWLYNDILPWWCFAIGSFLVGWAVPQKGSLAWLSGFFSIALLWLWLISKFDSANNGVLTSKMMMLIPVGDSPYGLLALCCFVGGLVSGFAALTGSFLRKKPSRVSQ